MCGISAEAERIQAQPCRLKACSAHLTHGHLLCHTPQVEVLFASAVACYETMVCGFALQVKDLQGQLKFKRTEVDDMLSAAQAKDRENSKLWEQVWPLRIACAVQQPRPPVLGMGSGGNPSHCMPALHDALTPEPQTWTRLVAVGHQPIRGQVNVLGVIGLALSSACRRCMCCKALQATCAGGGGTVFEAHCAMRQAPCAGALLLQQVGCDLVSHTLLPAGGLRHAYGANNSRRWTSVRLA